MTPLHRLLTFALVGGLLPGCSGDRAAPSERPPPLTALPPPVVGGVRPAPPASTIDSADWRLPDQEDGPTPWLRLLWVQDNRGEMEACGCPGAPTGGLARRATLGRELRSMVPGAVSVEGPNALTRAIVGIEQIEGRDRARGRRILELLAAWEPAAFFPGQADLAVVPLHELVSEAGFPLVITNLGDRGTAGVRSSLTLEVGERRALLLGLVRPAVSEAARRRLALRPAVSAAAEEVAKAGPVDLVVAFTDASLRDQTAWFEAGLDVDVLVVPGDAGQEGTSEWRGRILLVRSQPAGRSIERLDVVFSGGPGRGLHPRSPGEASLGQIARQEEEYLRQLLLLEALRAQEAEGRDPRVVIQGPAGEDLVEPRTDPDAVQQGLAEVKALRRKLVAGLQRPDPAGHAASMMKMTVRSELEEDASVQRSLDEFGAHRLAQLQQDVEAAPTGSRYLGHEACVGCHTREQGHWARTGHARAWATLVGRGEERNPDCLACHSTGFGAPGGFADPDTSRRLVGVQCEACHGPMELHVRQAGTPGYKPDPGRPVNEATCRTCHDPINSPQFDYAAYAPRVAHPGQGRTP